MFISYRRDDTAGHVGLLYEALSEHFGQDRVFIDYGSMTPGEDFVEATRRGLGSFGTVLAVIGPRWLSARDSDGRRRLDDPEDFVRFELEVALEQNAHVIPVLVGGATMPKADELPAPLTPLARRNALILSDQTWALDVRRLIETLRQLDDAAAEVPWSGIKQLPRDSS
jgi:hypothetical protein